MIMYVQTTERSVRSYREPVEFGDWEEDNIFTVDDISPNKVSTWDQGYDVSPDKDGYVHVLYVVYSSGDSFGRSTGNGDVVYVFQDRSLAEKAKELLEKDRESFSKDILLDSGETLKYGDPSVGYFECLESCEIKSFKVV